LDALYNARGVVRRGTTGDAGHFIGMELDLFVKYALDRHSSFLAGYSHFFPGGFIGGTGPDRDVDFVYTQYQFTF